MNLKIERIKPQFSKIHVVFADLLVAFVWISNVFLSWCDKQTISDLAISIVTVYGGFATGGYFALCGVRDCSLNKLEAIKYKGDNVGI